MSAHEHQEFSLTASCFSTKNEIAPSGVRHRSGQANISHAGVPRWTLVSREIICQCLPVTKGSLLVALGAARRGSEKRDS